MYLYVCPIPTKIKISQEKKKSYVCIVVEQYPVFILMKK